MSHKLKNDIVSKKRIIFKKIVKYLLFIIAAIIISVIINIFVLEISVVDGRSMEKTLYSGERLIIFKLGYLFYNPGDKDVVVLRYKKGVKPFQSIFINLLSKKREISDPGMEIDYIKRIIGSHGDIIDLKYEKVYLNNKILEEPYVAGITHKKSLHYPLVIPEGKFFIMGDNRSMSRDSRDIGLIDKNEIIGQALLRIWPLTKIGIIK
ncbi:MAG: signal peptidase I [Spirochaetales bacterium]|nr:signal peptidase I [Spirochaetales bacterium]